MQIKPEELGVTVQIIRKTHSKDLLVELKSPKEHRGRLEFFLKEVISESGSVRYLMPRVEVEISKIEPSIEVKDVEEAVKSFFSHGSTIDLKVSLTKRPFRSTRRVCDLLEEAWAVMLMGLQKEDVKLVLSLLWLWPHSGGLMGAC